MPTNNFNLNGMPACGNSHLYFISTIPRRLIFEWLLRFGAEHLFTFNRNKLFDKISLDPVSLGIQIVLITRPVRVAKTDEKICLIEWTV